MLGVRSPNAMAVGQRCTVGTNDGVRMDNGRAFVHCSWLLLLESVAVVLTHVRVVSYTKAMASRPLYPRESVIVLKRVKSILLQTGFE